MAYNNPNLLAVNASTFEGGTTAWVADPANTTVSVSTTEFFGGTRSMRITATAAGTATATSPRMLIAAGKTYTAYLPIRTNTTTAGRVATVAWTFYDAAVGGTAVGTASFVRTLDSLTGWSGPNRTSPWGVAPAGAVSATLTYSVSGLGAAEFYNLDDLYACEAPVVAGNLIDWGASSTENDVSGWAPGANTTLTREFGVLAADDGFYLMAATGVAPGRVDVTSAVPIPVVAGTEYEAQVRIYPGTETTVTTQQEIRWFDAADALISISPRVDSATSAGGVSRLSKVVDVAPPGTVSARLYVGADVTAVASSVLFGILALRVAPNLPGNLLTYDEYSSESEVKPWTLTGGTGIQRVQANSPITDGWYMAQFTPTAQSIITLSLDRLIPVIPGATYTAKGSYFGFNETAETTSILYRARIDWYDAAEELFQADNPDQFYSTDVVPFGNNGAASTEARTCPEGAAFARVSFEFDHSSSLVSKYNFDSASLVESEPEYTLHADDETGSVTLTVLFVSTAETTVTVERVDESGAITKLRGYGIVYDRAPYTPGPMVIEDYEAPLSSTVWYRVTWYYESGIRGNRLFTQTVKAPVLADGDHVWFKSPGIPALNTRVMMEAPPVWSRVSRSSRYDIVGRKNPIHVTGTRAGHTASISVLIWDEDSNAQFNALLDSGLPALLQAMPGYGVGGSRYLSIGDVEVEPLSPDARDDGWRWSLDVVEIDRPEGGLQGSALSTWQTIYDTYATWEDLFDAHETWTTVLTGG